MANLNFKVKSGLNIPITSAAILTTDANGNISSTSVLPIANGGTGQTSANNALNALLPLQTSNANYFLQTNATNTQWSKVYYQTIQNNGVAVNPRGNLNIVGGTFTDSAGSDLTTVSIPAPTAQSTEPTSLSNGLIWVNTAGTGPTVAITRWSKSPANGTTVLSGADDNGSALQYTAGYEQVFLNGTLLSRTNDYTATNGTSITLLSGTVTGDIVEVVGALQLSYSDTIPKSLITAKGDIIVGSAASTPTNLAVGANYQTVIADSTQTGGIRWGDDLAVATIMGAYL